MVSLLLIAALTTAGQSADVGDADNKPVSAPTSDETASDNAPPPTGAQAPAGAAEAGSESQTPTAEEGEATEAPPPPAPVTAAPSGGTTAVSDPEPEETASNDPADDEPAGSAGNAAGDGYMLFVGAGVLVVGVVVGVVCALAAAGLQWGVVMNPAAGGTWRSPSVMIVQVLVLSAVVGAGAAVMGADIVAFSLFGE